MNHPALALVGHLVEPGLSVVMEASGRALTNIPRGLEFSGGSKPWTQVSQLSGSGPTPSWSIKTPQAMWHRRRGKKRTKPTNKQETDKTLTNGESKTKHTKTHKERHFHTHKKKKKRGNKKEQSNQQTNP